MRKVISIKNFSGEELPIEEMDILFVGEDYVLAKYKGYGFLTNYNSADGYTVTIEEN